MSLQLSRRGLHTNLFLWALLFVGLLRLSCNFGLWASLYEFLFINLKMTKKKQFLIGPPGLSLNTLLATFFS